MKRSARRVSRLGLRFLVSDNCPDRPQVRVLVDGREAFTDQLPGWQGFDPDELLGDRSVLLPEDQGRRVAVYRCSCGIEGCGVVAAFIQPSPDGRWVSWVDFRNFVGVFVGPTARVSTEQGSPWPLRDLHFDRDQYVAEIQRASADRSWETPRRATARLVAAGLGGPSGVIPAGLDLQWVLPAWDGEGIRLGLRSNRGEPAYQQVLGLTSQHRDPQTAARHIIDQLRAVPVDQWPSRFGWTPPAHR